MKREHTKPIIARLVDDSSLVIPAPTPNEDEFLRRVESDEANPEVDDVQLAELVWSAENPLLTVHPSTGRPVIDRDAYDSPIFQFMLDRIERKRIALGKLNTGAARARFSMTVAEAASELNVHPSSVRVAIKTHRLAAIKEGGEYRLDPASVAGYQVSTRGARAIAHVKSAAAPEPGIRGPLVARHGRDRDHLLRVKWDSGTKYANPHMVRAGVNEGEIPQGWTKAIVHFGNKVTGKFQSFLLEPRKDEAPLTRDEITFAGFFVHGAFQVRKKINNPRKALEAWKGFNSQ